MQYPALPQVIAELPPDANELDPRFVEGISEQRAIAMCTYLQERQRVVYERRLHGLKLRRGLRAAARRLATIDLTGCRRCADDRFVSSFLTFHSVFEMVERDVSEEALHREDLCKCLTAAEVLIRCRKRVPQLLTLAYSDREMLRSMDSLYSELRVTLNDAIAFMELGVSRQEGEIRRRMRLQQSADAEDLCVRSLCLACRDLVALS